MLSCKILMWLVIDPKRDSKTLQINKDYKIVFCTWKIFTFTWLRNYVGYILHFSNYFCNRMSVIYIYFFEISWMLQSICWHLSIAETTPLVLKRKINKRIYVLGSVVTLLFLLVNGMGAHFLFPKHLIHYMNKCLCGHKFNQ